MPVYAYTSLDARRRGLAVRRVGLQGALGARGEHRAGEGGGGRASGPAFPSRLPLRRRVDPGRVTDLLRELATLLAVGVPLAEALGVAAAGHAGRLRTVLLDVRGRVAAGSTLAAAMGRHPGAFDELCLRVVGVGEQSGPLGAALLRLGEHRGRGRHYDSLLYFGFRMSPNASCRCLILAGSHWRR